MLSLHTNAASLSTQNSVGNTQRSLSSSMSKLGTGYRVNSAMDDAAGLQIATRLDAQTRGMAVAQKNTQNGISMMQTAEGALSEVTSIVQRMKDLATESATASTSEDDRTALQSEYDALGTELGNILKNTSFGGAKLFSDGTTTDGTGGLLDATELTFQIGASSGETMKVDTQTGLGALATALDAISSNYAASGTAGTELGTTDPATANGMIDKLEDALDAIGTYRSTLGAASNRLDHVYNNLANMSTNTSAAKSRIMDVDYASETANMTSQQLLLQAGTSMLKQSGSMSQLALSLLS
ncbi:flagellin N-terminal helical domain-containing protein [Rubrivivax gelatinosus]|uniref:Flagellin n=1 Tax=Rubrivivax gelatinosus TaxID=28068 RepID=A0A4R2ME72_RUBGE|nr:flagellin [Rubrivivax gelatinosus]MBK1689994.1 Lateral flagellin [Rubrivivax gelatinosus]TCP03495.1 flagellin [Rubrivivax gelatinosus]